MPKLFKKIPNSYSFSDSRVIESLPHQVYGQGAFGERGVLQCSLETSQAPFVLARVAQPHHLLYVVREGEFVVRSELGEARVLPGQALIVPAGLLRQIALGSPSMRLVFLWLADRPDWAFLRGSGLKVVDAPWGSQLESLFRAFRLEALGDAEPRILDLYSEQVLSLIDRLWGFGVLEANDCRRRMKSLWAEVSSKPQAPWMLEALARRMGLSPIQCYRMTLEQEGMPPMAMVRQIRMHHAARLLNHSSDSLDQIAEAVGYGSAYSFSRAFQREFDERPGRWRRRPVQRGQGEKKTGR